MAGACAQSGQTQDQAITAALNEICPADFLAAPIPAGLGPNLDRYCNFRRSFGLVIPGDPGGDSGSATSQPSDPRQSRGGEAVVEERVQGDWRFYLSASGGNESKRPTRFEPGFDLDLETLAVGLERNLGARQVGVIAGFEHREGDYLNSGGGRFDSDAQLLQLYLNGSVGASVWYGVAVRRAWHDYTTIRRLRYEDPDSLFAFLGVDALLPSRSSMREWALQADVCREWDLGEGLAAGLNAGVDYSRRRFNGFAERGDAALRLAYAGRTEASLIARVGAELRRAISSAHGVYLPRLALGWQHEFRDDGDDILARFAEDLRDNPTAVVFATDPPDRNSGTLDLGLGWYGAEGWSAYAGYRRQLEYRDHNRSALALTIGREF